MVCGLPTAIFCLGFPVSRGTRGELVIIDFHMFRYCVHAMLSLGSYSKYIANPVVSITWLKTWFCYHAHKMLSLSSLAYSVFHIASYLPNICSHFFTGFIRDPTPHLNALANLGEFIIIPSILKLN